MGQRLLLILSAAVLCGGLAAAQEAAPAPGPPPPAAPDARPEKGRFFPWSHGHGEHGPRGPLGARPSEGPLKLAPDHALMFLLMEAPPAELDRQLAKWPRFQQMSDTDKRQFRMRLEQFRQGRRQAALGAAKQLQLAVPPDREDAFVNDFWRGRRTIEETLTREMEPRRRELESKFRSDLTTKYAPPPP